MVYPIVARVGLGAVVCLHAVNPSTPQTTAVYLCCCVNASAHDSAMSWLPWLIEWLIDSLIYYPCFSAVLIMKRIHTVIAPFFLFFVFCFFSGLFFIVCCSCFFFVSRRAGHWPAQPTRYIPENQRLVYWNLQYTPLRQAASLFFSAPSRFTCLHNRGGICLYWQVVFFLQSIFTLQLNS